MRKIKYLGKRRELAKLSSSHISTANEVCGCVTFQTCPTAWAFKDNTVIDIDDHTKSIK